MTEATAKFTIGSIVTFSTNHLTSVEHFETISLSGDPRFITPLMVVTEILLEKVNYSDPKEGEGQKTSYKYKCIWFSTRNLTLEEVWLKEKQLISLNAVSTREKAIILIGQKVSLITAPLELKKRKSSISWDGDSTKRKIAPLIDFVSPVFQVTGIINHESKEPLIDSKTGKTKRWVIEKQVKCKFFNLQEDKYSEILIPIEALMLISENEKLLQNLVTAKKHESVCIIKILEDEVKELVFWGIVSQIQSLNGHYSIVFDDILTQQLREFKLDEITEIDLKEGIKIVEHYPFIQSIGSNFKVESIEDYLDRLYDYYWEHKPKDPKVRFSENVFYIRYKNRFERLTSRYIIPIEVLHANPKFKKKPADESEKKEDVEKYLYAFCLLRNEYRYFNVTDNTNRIQKLEVIRDEKLFEYGIHQMRIATSND